jgi:F-type H+-transporting ATPase subunit gamma
VASLRDIRKRIKSVKNTQKITGAMKLIAASRLRKAQEAILHARPFALELGSMLRRVATRADTGGGEFAHPLLTVHPTPRRVMLVVITSDRGLAGAFNANILRRAERFIRENKGKYETFEIATIGRKARDHFKKRSLATVRDYSGVFENLTFRRATEIAEGIAEEFVKSDLDAVFLLYNEFKSAIAQQVVVEPLLPIVHEELPAGDSVDYIYEPSQHEVLERLVPRYVATLIWRSLLESSAAEHGARMTAMDNAARNAKDIVDALTLQYNRARQATITKELMEVIGGAEALAG